MSNSSENSVARNTILASIRASLAASAPFDAVHTEYHGHADILAGASRPTISRQDLTDDFKQNLESVGGQVSVVSGEADAAKALGNIIAQLGAKRIAISNSDLIGRLIPTDTTLDVSENTPSDELFGCDLGITSAQYGIAETGTLVLESARESHRLTSLVPPIHVCILRGSNIRQTLGEILELTEKDLNPAVTFITGASRTSDIELTLAIGVHGPGELYVIIIADQ